MSAFASLKWTQPTLGRPGATVSAEAICEAKRSLTGLFSLSGRIKFDPDQTPKQRAIHLLKAAAEVEHQFVVQYLYAYYCGGQDTELLTIAKEEMGHLITVQNLLAMIQTDDAADKPPYLERMGPLTDEEQPSPFRLEPLSLPFIARFLVAESGEGAALPADIDKPLAEDGLDMCHVHRVGMLYAYLYTLFQDDTNPLGPWMIPLGSDHSRFASVGHLSDDDLADPKEVAGKLGLASDWGGTTDLMSAGTNILVLPVADFTNKRQMRQRALEAIYLVAGQGEGLTNPPSGAAEASHAQRLRDIYDRLTGGELVAPGKDIYPTDPYTTPKTETPDSEPNLIRAEPANAQAKETDTIYERMLLQIARAVSADTSEERTNAIGEAIYGTNGMYALGGSATSLVTRPRPPAPASQTLLAAPPFRFPAEGIPQTLAEIKARLS